MAVSGVRSSCETARRSAVLSASECAQRLGLDVGVGEPLALLRERQHARERTRDALGDLVVEHRRVRAHQLQPPDHAAVDVERQRDLPGQRAAAEHDARGRSADRGRRDAGGVDLRELEARAAHERAREPGEQRRLALPLVGLLRAPPLARGQLGDRGAGQEQRGEQQPDARVGRLEALRRQQHGVEDRDRGRRREHARAQAEEERHADHRGQVDEAERLVVRAQRAVEHRDHARADRHRQRSEHERRDRVPARADAGTATRSEAGHPARAAGQGHASSLPRAGRILPKSP